MKLTPKYLAKQENEDVDANNYSRYSPRLDDTRERTRTSDMCTDLRWFLPNSSEGREHGDMRRSIVCNRVSFPLK